ncbi:hypothetical protein F441_15246 [Phytophthora nicotianae CJ01A1]|uniref:Sugar transporter SWEET1 n=2 Tax=Phytophthora nicotianae TaxID=4792 RepID=W2WED4_PHYNI|nr:hypothetical protein F444_15425 [Phytophthora nicotianae P1976]ETP08836.1 hypothetical protein F441_15246 [Phytophthora nicotianae CJ01A1]
MTGWKTVLDVVTALGQVMLNLSLGPDMYTIHRRKNIGEMPALPQVSMLVNCHLWMCYGILRDSIFPVAVSQGFGQLAAVVFNLVYFHWSPQQARKDTLKLYVAGIVLHCIVTLYFVLSLAGVTDQSNYDSSIVLGYFGVFINVCMFASPFATLKHVVQTKSAVSIPINLSLMIFASSVLWVATGLLDSDYFITGLNLAGVVLGAIQMVLYYIYRPGRAVEQYGSNGELPIVVSPTSKSAGVVMTTESPVYKPLSSPTGVGKV